jgi:Tol biopolymer transport system component
MPSYAVPRSEAYHRKPTVTVGNGSRVDESEHTAPGGSDRSRPEVRLDSWKKIASYLRRDVSTVQRWERREGLPVHRHLHDKQGSVFAFRTEVDAWWEGRRSGLAQEVAPAEPASGQPAAAEAAPFTSPSRIFPAYTRWLVVALVLVGAAGAAAWAIRYSGHPWRSPLDEAHFTRVVDFPGFTQAAAISRDGRLVAFLGEQGGHTDAWVSELGTGLYRNLTRGQALELVNPSVRTLGFSPDSSLVSIWTRGSDGSHPSDVNIISVPARGGIVAPYLRGVAEFDWSHKGMRLVYHTTAPGDPLFVRDQGSATSGGRKIYTGPAGVHCHFPVWSADDEYIYFMRGVPPDDWDLWRIRPTGSNLEQLTSQHSHLSYPVVLDGRNLAYLATDADGSGPWMYVMDLEQRRLHRISSGLESFTSLAASADGTKLVATISAPRDSIWRLPLSSEGAHPASQPAPVKVLSNGAMPRLSEGTLVYTAASGDSEGIWVRRGENAREIWRSKRAHILSAPTISDDGKQMAFSTGEDGKTELNVVELDGSHLRRISDSLELRGSAAWFPDGLSLLWAVVRDGEPRLMRIFLNGEPPAVFVAEYSIDPVWAPDHHFLVYSGADIGTTFPIRAAAPDGRPFPITGVLLTRGARRVAFYPTSASLLILDGEIGHKNFWLMDLATGARQQVAKLPGDYDVRDFDVSPTDSQIVFDRIEANSEMALIDRALR